MSKPKMSTLTMCTFLYANYNWKKLTYRKKSSSSSESSSKRFLCQKNEKDLSFLMQKNYETSGKRKETSSRLLTFSRLASGREKGKLQMPRWQLEPMGQGLLTFQRKCFQFQSMSLAWQSWLPFPFPAFSLWAAGNCGAQCIPEGVRGDIRAETKALLDT